MIAGAKELSNAFDRLVETLINLSEAYDSHGDIESSDKVLEEVDKLTEEFQSIKLQASKFIAKNMNEWTSSSESSFGLKTWVTQQEQQLQNTYKLQKKFQEEAKAAKSSVAMEAKAEIGHDMWRQLDRVSILKFSGNKHYYPSWKSAFVACIVKALATPEYKLLQLRQCLQGEPLRVVEKLGHSPEAYEAAKECLETKYGGERRLISLCLDELEAFRPIKNGHTKALEKFADLLDIAVVNLEQAGLHGEIAQGTLYVKLQKKLSKTMLTSYRRWIIDNNKGECVKSLREFVHREAEFHSVAFETIHGMGKRVHEGASSVGDNSQRMLFGSWKESPKQNCCEICNQNHPIWKCFKLQNLTAQQRWQMIQKLNLCYCCLGKNHTIQSCHKIRPCGINGCPKFHNRLLHKLKEPRSDIQNRRDEKKSEQIEERTAKISTSEKKED